MVPACFSYLFNENPVVKSKNEDKNSTIKAYTS